jgi:hypothetical protein
MSVPTVPHKCTNCGNQNTGTHYEHIRLSDGDVHIWDQVPSPNDHPQTGFPEPQPCPIDGCLTFNLPGVPPPPVYPAVHAFCLDCGNLMLP